VITQRANGRVERADDDKDECREPLWPAKDRRDRVGPGATSEDFRAGAGLLDAGVWNNSVSLQPKLTLLDSFELLESAGTRTSEADASMPRHSPHATDPAAFHERSDDIGEQHMSHICQRSQRMVTRSIAFEVLEVTQFTSHCLRISLLADEVEKCELISGQELLLAHVGTV